MVDGENGQQARDAQRGNCQGADSEPHRVHLLAAERELIIECHRHGVYLALCGALLPVSELASSVCEEQCERMVTYCQDCVQRAASENADAGLVLSPRRNGGMAERRG